MSIAISDLIKEFPKAVIIDMTRKNIIVTSKDKVKVYPEKQYRKFLDGLDLWNFEGEQ